MIKYTTTDNILVFDPKKVPVIYFENTLGISNGEVDRSIHAVELDGGTIEHVKLAIVDYLADALPTIKGVFSTVTIRRELDNPELYSILFSDARIRIGEIKTEDIFLNGEATPDIIFTLFF